MNDVSYGNYSDENDCIQKVRKLCYTIHNPNTIEETAKALLAVLVQANAGKVERKFRELAESRSAYERLNGGNP